jgi:KAP family P-loop domain
VYAVQEDPPVWADNETTNDLLGFDHLVDALELVLTDQKMLPVTVGVAGDWGSGKTSLMQMAEDRLSISEKVVTVSFSPWRFEGYDDMKAALMAAVIEAISKRVTKEEPLEQRVGTRLKRLARTIGLVRVAPIAAAAVATAGHAPPPVAAAAAEVAGAVAEAATAPEPEPEPIASIAAFREEFDRLMGELGDDVSMVVVFVDDLDRCLPETIIDTFEAIRLFLHVRKTAYVIAAHPRIVEAAIDSRYEANRRGDENLGRDYLEKILQVVITVPALAEPEVESFINLLFAEEHLSGDPLDRLREEARRRRSEDQLAVVMNYGIAREVLGAPQADLDRDFSLASRIAPILARGLRGNPRQIKRFLNTLTLRLATAKRRGVELDPAVLAKLMVLELDLGAFERLFRWQLAQDGRPSQLAEAEAAVSAGTIDSLKDELGAWAAKPSVAEWLALEPPLAPVALGRYFFFSRDRLSPAAPAARLSAGLQELLARLLLVPDALRRQGVAAAAELAPEELPILFEVLIEQAVRDPSGRAMESAMELAASNTQLIPAFVEALESAPPTSVPPALPPKLALLFKDSMASLDPVFDRWESAGAKGLAAAVRSARGRSA